MPAGVSLQVQRGSTWEEEFTYTEEDGSVIDLTGYKARLQVRTEAGRFGTTAETTLLLEKNTDDDPDEIFFDDAEDGVLKLKIPPEDVALLNAGNVKKNKVAYAIELFKDTETPEYVIPLVAGSISVRGETAR